MLFDAAVAICKSYQGCLKEGVVVSSPYGDKMDVLLSDGRLDVLMSKRSDPTFMR